MEKLPKCVSCSEDYTYMDQDKYVCPMCGHEWADEVEEVKVIKDSNGNILTDGDTVTVIKDLKIDGGSSVVKRGTKAKNIRLIDGDHDIACRLDGHGAMKLKSEFVKKI